MPQCPVCRCPLKDGAHKRDHLQEYHPEHVGRLNRGGRW
jgi:hypothetical protein